MIRTLIVDDEHLVRKGLVFTVPWKECGFEIVAEADNGESALDIIDRVPIDLLLTDLTMPVMDGFELMRIVKERYPAVRTVVLTCHQDFHFLQDAMRLGAIDYVVKTDIADNVLEEMLLRISERIVAEQAQGGLAEAAGQAKQTESRQSLIVMLPELGKAQVRPAGLDGAVQIQDSIWMVPGKTSSEIDALLSRIEREGEAGKHSYARVTNWPDKPRTSDWLPMLKERMFYESYANDEYIVSLSELTGEKPSTVDVPALIRQAWRNQRWLFDKKEFEELMLSIREGKPSYRSVVAMFEELAAAWELLAVNNRLWPNWRSATAAFTRLDEWQHWYEQSSRSIAQYARSRGFSNDVFIAIMRALEMLHTDSGESANRTELSAKVNLSQSYFSTIFKEIIGKSFHEAVKEARLEKAKHMLVQHADMPIYWIAEKTGFQDEKYFSKIFRLQTGMVPSEFRERQLRR
ncbi:helix-turn-helix domain-containing protein [Paenibacillus sp. CF384]|uniref:helix-turn-helix domain-containing protein n=1 Tax=Paenibacillus sp. CF384 TaxID=1884382 RepID=UPI00089496EA|nr:helix-turn-helix domain-containing protein [Paenibacillus sp. CF384]SDX14545.1 two-component system, response regulator YesN [Paenibacillus sp. CF384]